VKAAIDQVQKPSKLPGAIAGLVDLIKPAVVSSKGKSGNLLETSTTVNVQRQVARLRSLDPIIAPGVKSGKVKVVGGVFDLSSGKVTMLG
jgi:carbonic anhydrase